MRRARAPLRATFALLAIASVTLAMALGACTGEPSDPVGEATEIPADMASAAAVTNVVESNYGTPVKDRVATLGLLNKRNNLEQDLVMKVGESRRIGNVIVKLANCEKTLPWETPPETGAFVQVLVEERAGTDSPLAWRKVFSGWLFRNSPSANVIEHPVYDVWVKDCAMKFPGEEEDPAAAASASSPAKPAGKPAPEAVAVPAASPTSEPAAPDADGAPVAAGPD